MPALRVLHVEVAPDINEVVRVSLALDPEVVTRSCAWGGDALALAAQWPPDIILLDGMRPGMDGAAMLAWLRRNGPPAAIPVVFMTAPAQNNELDHLRSLGAAGVIPSPCDPTTLAGSLRRFVRPLDGWLDSMQSVFLRRVDDDVVILKQQRSVLEDQAASPAALCAIRKVAHGLAGASGIFGFPAIGDLAAALEDTIISQSDTAGTFDEIARAVDRLLGCVEMNIIQRAEQSIKDPVSRCCTS